MNQLSRGQKIVLTITAIPMVLTGIAGAMGTYSNYSSLLHRSATSLGLVAAGEGATLVCALVMLSLTLLGQSTPLAVRSGLWLVPMLAAGTGAVLATSHRDAVIMAVTPLAMTVSAEGLGLVTRRVVAFGTGAERRAGEFLWLAHRARNHRWGLVRRHADAAVWRNVRETTASDGELSAMIDKVRRDAVTAAVQNQLSQVLQIVATDVAPAPDLLQIPASPVAGIVAPLVSPATEYIAPPAPPEQLSASVQQMAADDLASVPDVALTSPIPYMTTNDVAAAKGVKPGTVRSWKHRGIITPVSQDDNGRDLYHPIDIAGLTVGS